ncbi:SRPBCC family protein [Paractinoplanes lichenicola]|uniref:SRPBCC domain-containing protein n=1 Tax=Paractinoplanes lichenicola TaxID=2802976 RepID=A0ABS1VX00_9ACTN|nr:SRPBCC domain-containing protein [Actinoplanes lichenicola]MBL7258985.1 SRPBCC domain-containing protein [Actinoplanes lichenicola]
MPVLDMHRDEQNLTLTMVASFDAPPERVWQVWEDPRQLERWWGPPTWPATFDTHDFRVGGRSAYYMTGPDGTKAHGWWQFTAIEAPARLAFDDGFADENGAPAPSPDPTHATVTLEADGAGRTRMTVVSQFGSLDHLQTMAKMGMEEGLRLAAGQIDGVLA